MCLLSLTSGVRTKLFDHVRREVTHAYGFEHVFTLSNMERLGLFNRQVKKSAWQQVWSCAATSSMSILMLGYAESVARFEPMRSSVQIRRSLRLTLEESEREREDYSNLKDMHFAYNGYAPLSARLVELSTNGVGMLPHLYWVFCNGCLNCSDSVLINLRGPLCRRDGVDRR